LKNRKFFLKKIVANVVALANVVNAVIADAALLVASF
jgi:hypothetical protein